MKEWDKLIKDNEYQSAENKHTYGFLYMSNKKQYTFDSRDFYEKCFVFYYNNTYYRFSSFMDNDE